MHWKYLTLNLTGYTIQKRDGDSRSTLMTSHHTLFLACFSVYISRFYRRNL